MLARSLVLRVIGNPRSTYAHSKTDANIYSWNIEKGAHWQ